MITIRVLTQVIDKSGIDPYDVIRDEAFEEQRQRYISMYVQAVRKEYPDADVDDEPGNGMDTVRVVADDERKIREDVEQIGMGVFQEWGDTVPAEAYK